jgi:hypothetical protein
MCIVYLQLELEAWRSGRGKQQSGEYRDSEDPHSAKAKFQAKLKLKIASKLVQYHLLLHIYLCFMFLYIFMSCPFLIFIYRSWSRLKALLYGARTPEIQYCVGSTPFLTDWECAWTGWGGEVALAPLSQTTSDL